MRRVIASVQDGDAHLTVLVYCRRPHHYHQRHQQAEQHEDEDGDERTVRMPHVADKSHLRRIERIVGRELEPRCEDAALVFRAWWSPARPITQLPHRMVLFIHRRKREEKYMTSASHSKKLSSSSGPTVMPSGGLTVSSGGRKRNIQNYKIQYFNYRNIFKIILASQ